MKGRRAELSLKLRYKHQIAVVPYLEDHFKGSNVVGTFVVYHPKFKHFLVSENDRVYARFLPASSFKIPNALIALETGVVKDEDEVIPYGGGKEYFKSWEKDMTLPQAMKASNVAVFHTVAKRIGLESYRDKLNDFGYGNADPGDSIDQRFWLTGPLGVSPIEQVEFLRKLIDGALPVSDRSFELVKSMIQIEETDEYSLYAKSGWAGPDDPQIGWWVGWVEKEGSRYPFALNIDIKNNEDAKQREVVARACLKELLQLE